MGIALRSIGSSSQRACSAIGKTVCEVGTGRSRANHVRYLVDALTVGAGVLGRAYSEAKMADMLPPGAPPNGGISRFR